MHAKMIAAMRAFIAIEIPAEVRDVLAACCAELAKLPATASWTKPGNIHLTLKFLGEIPEESQSSIHQAMQRAATGIGSFGLKLQGLGAFPNLRRPRVLWAGLGGEVEAAKDLQSRLEEECSKIGLPRDDKKFSPHLTLARLKEVHDPRRWTQGVEAYRIAEKSFQVAALKLFRSELHPQGAQYTVLAEAQLAPRL